MNNSQNSLTVAQVIKALNLCYPDDKIQFFTPKGEEINIVFVEKSCQRDTVYLLSEIPRLNDTDGASMISNSKEVPYLGDFVRWEDEACE